MTILKKSTFSILNNLHAVLNLSRLMTNVYGSANIIKELIKVSSPSFSAAKHNAKLTEISTFSFVLNAPQVVLN